MFSKSCHALAWRHHSLTNLLCHLPFHWSLPELDRCRWRLLFCWELRRGQSVSTLIGLLIQLVKFHRLFHIYLNNGGCMILLSKYSRGFKSPKIFPAAGITGCLRIKREDVLGGQGTKRSVLDIFCASRNPRLLRRKWWNRCNLLKSKGWMESVNDFVWGSHVSRRWFRFSPDRFHDGRTRFLIE